MSKDLLNWQKHYFNMSLNDTSFIYFYFSEDFNPLKPKVSQFSPSLQSPWYFVALTNYYYYLFNVYYFLNEFMSVPHFKVNPIKWTELLIFKNVYKHWTYSKSNHDVKVGVLAVGALW